MTGTEGEHRLVQPVLFRALAPGVAVSTGAGDALADIVLSTLRRHGRTAGTTVLTGPPVLPRRTVERTGYLVGFPHLLGAVRTFAGSRRDHVRLLDGVLSGDDWTAALAETDLVLAPASCHAVYEVFSGSQVDDVEVEILGTCFRQEPSLEPTRFRSFRLLEYVFLGSASGAQAFVERWAHLVPGVCAELGLTVRSTAATDLFLGGSPTEATGVRKTEFVFEETGTSFAVASINLHGEHFSVPFEIRSGTAPAATACVGFGIERLLHAVTDAESSVARELRDLAFERGDAGEQVIRGREG